MPFARTSQGQPPNSTNLQQATARPARFAALLVLAAFTASAHAAGKGPTVPGQGPVQAGYALSKLHCARCHIVHPNDRFTGHASTPSFMIMIEALEDWPDRFDSFMGRNPHPAHLRLLGSDARPDDLPATTSEVILTLDEIEDILAYVDFLAEELGHPRPD